MSYQPEPPSSKEEILEWVFRELSKIGEALSGESDFVLMRVAHVAPAKPREGLLAFADGTDWNPGSGRGTYEYRSGAWAKL